MHGTIQLPKTASHTTGHWWMALLLCLAGALALAAPTMRSGVYDSMSTDDAMRLVEIRDLLAGQSWFDLTQYRLDPPNGASMHWSRLIDLPIAMLMLALRPLLGTAGAEQAALVIWPTLMLAAALALVGMIAVRMSDGVRRRDVALAAMVAAVLTGPSLVHFRSGAIDHHSGQIVLLLCFLYFAAEIERSVRSAMLAGISATLSLAIGLEMLPAIAAGCVAVLGLLIWRGSAVASTVAAFGAALAGSAVLLTVLLLQPESLTPLVLDAFGGPLVLLLVGGGVCLMIVGAVAARTTGLAARLAATAATGLLFLAVFFALYPKAIASPYGAVDPLVSQVWLDHISESKSLITLLTLEPERIPDVYVPVLLTLLLAAMVVRRVAPEFRFRWILAAGMLTGLFALSLWQIRGAAGATLLAAPLFVAGLVVLRPRLERPRLLLAVVLLSPAVLVAAGTLLRPLLDKVAPPEKIIAKQDGGATCSRYSSLAPLAALPAARIMAPIDFGPGILAATGHSVFAGPYHRNNDGNLAMIRVMMAEPDAARNILRERQVDYVALCRGSFELQEILDLAPNGLAARLGRGEVPGFLQPVALPSAGKLAVWRVRP